ncbi:MAG: isopentenyl transferase family protein, partial [Pseudomonadota bacterium]
MPPSKPRVVVITGPTASGKSSVAVELAERFHGETVSADSIQVYRHMDIGSAKPTRAERARVPHHMIDIRDPDEPFSAGDYVTEGRECIRGISARGRTAFVVGGTGLYIRTLLGGIIGLPPSDPGLRASLR